jgi:hypothetical protein
MTVYVIADFKVTKSELSIKKDKIFFNGKRLHPIWRVSGTETFHSNNRMSAIGTKPTPTMSAIMSVVGGIADIPRT